VETVTGVAIRIPVTESSRISEARRTALGLAEQLDFDETKAGQVAIVVTEAATNLLKHAGGGEILLKIAGESGSGARLDLLALDKGPGIRNMGESLRDGQSTAGTSGTGLGAIARLSDAFEIYSQPGKGTAILAQFRPRRALLKPTEAKRPLDGRLLDGPSLEVDGFSIAVDGEQLSGDGWSYHHTPTGLVAFLADGLGHGPLAEVAARDAIQAFEKNSTRPPTELLEAVHQATRSTRGAAVAVACINVEERLVRFAGIGNISGTLIAGAEVRHMVSMNGIIGHQVRAFREFTYPWQEDTLMMLQSDGLGTHWDLRNYPGLGQKPCGLIAGVLYRDLARGRDDATSVVIRQHTGGA
jgi:anti-sigma regulatory factor (Ser/Thr protein kinase)